MVKKRDLLAPVGAEAAVKEIAQRLGAARPPQGPEGSPVLFAVGPSVANEDAFAIGLLARRLGVRVCSTDLSGTGTARAALRCACGRGTPPGSLDALGCADRIWVFGADLENFPQICSRLTRAGRRGAEVVFFDLLPAPAGSGRRSEILIPPGAAGLLPLLLQKAALESEWIPEAARTAPGFGELASWWRSGKAQPLPEHEWLPDERARELAGTLAKASSPAVVIGERWLASEGQPAQTVRLLQALALLGVEEKVLVAAGECNSWGVFDMIQQDPAAPSPLLELLDPAATCGISALFVFGDDLLRRAPQAGALAKRLAGIGTVVVADRFAGEMQRLAHVVLPTCCFGELDGTLTSGFGMVQRWRQAVKPPGECSPEATWVAKIGRRLGIEEWPATRKQWFEALQKENPLYAGDDFDRLYPSETGAGAPLGERSSPAFSSPSLDGPQPHPAEFPLRLAFAANPAGWSTGALSLREELLRRECPESTLTVHPADLKAAGLKPGWPAKVVTPGGEAVLTAQEGRGAPSGVMVVAPLPGSPAAALRGLMPSSDRTGLGTQPVPARLEKA